MPLVAAWIAAVWAALSAPARAQPGACPEPTSLDDFEVAAAAGERAFAQVDLVALGAARSAALDALPCLQERITPDASASFHRMMGMAAFTSGDEQGVLAEFYAARRLEPGYRFPLEVAGPGHPLADLYDRAAADVVADRQLEAVIPPAGGFVIVDGAVDATRPLGMSALVQAWTADQRLLETRFVLADDPTPRWGPLPIDVARKQARRRALLSVTGATALATVSLYTAAAVTEARFKDLEDPVPDEDLRALRATNNSLLWSSAAAGAITAGLGVTVAVLW